MLDLQNGNHSPHLMLMAVLFNTEVGGEMSNCWCRRDIVPATLRHLHFVNTTNSSICQCKKAASFTGFVVALFIDGWRRQAPYQQGERRPLLCCCTKLQALLPWLVAGRAVAD